MQFRRVLIALTISTVGIASGAFRWPVDAGTHSTVIAATTFLPGLVNLGQKCYDVVNFGADPTGIADSTSAFRRAFSAASIQEGVAVCAPAGTFVLTGDITLYSAATAGRPQGGPSFFGAGPGLTVLTTNVPMGTPYQGTLFDSCPGFSNVTPVLGVPSACPSLPTQGGTTTPNPNSPLSGVVFANFSIARPVSAPATGSDFYFPEMTSLLVDNVCTSGSDNVFDLGDQSIPSSWGLITVRDSSCGYSFSGHFVGLHGRGGGLIVTNNTLNAEGVGIALDTSDVTNTTAGSAGVMSWLGNTITQPAIGMFLFVSALSGSTLASGIQDSQWRTNNYTSCVFACYYLGLDPGISSNSPNFGHITIADHSASSLYDVLLFSGADYTTATGGGIQGIQVGGPSTYLGSLSGTASSILLITGSPSPGDQVAINWNPTGISPVITTVTAMPGDNTKAMVQRLSGLIAAPSPIAQWVGLANPNYGLLGMHLVSPPPVASYTAQPYTIITTGHLTALGLATPVSCTVPGTSTPALCYHGSFDNGDAVAMRRGAHDLDFVGLNMISPYGAAFHLWPDGGDQFHLLSNVLGRAEQMNSTTSIQLDASVSMPPTDFHIAGNDLVGAANGIVNLLPSPTFTANGVSPALRSHRGAAGLPFAPVTYGNPFSFTISNAGPTDCTYYFDWSSASAVSLTLALAGPSSTTIAATPPPAEFWLPVGASLSVGGSGTVSYTAMCEP
jgi:hypothetical protein